MGTFTYTPDDPDFAGTDQFTYQVCDDGNTCCEDGIVTLIINALPDLDEEYLVENGTWTQGTDISMCSGLDVILNFPGNVYTGWVFEWTGPNGFYLLNDDGFFQ